MDIGERDVMKTMRGLLMVAVALLGLSGSEASAGPGMHRFEFTSIDGDALPMSAFAGQAVLVVNTASLCGFTYQYAALQDLWESYRDRGLVLLGVPSNDFGRQEPGSEAEIKEFCEVNFDIDFPLTAKQVVKGEAAHPLFREVVDVLGPEAAPRWNFHKYLIDRDGRVVASFPSQVTPNDKRLVSKIEELL